MPPKSSKGRGRKDGGDKEREREERERKLVEKRERMKELAEYRRREKETEEQGPSSPEEEDEGARASTQEDPSDDDRQSTTGQHSKSVSYTFTAQEEERMVEFFAANDCFYNKCSRLYTNQTHKTKVLAPLAEELRSTSEYSYLSQFVNCL